MQPVALPPDGQARVPFVDGDAGSGFQQALGQAEPAEPASGHRDPKTAHRPGPEDGSSPGACGGIRMGGVRGRPRASARVIACRIHQVAYVENL